MATLATVIAAHFDGRPVLVKELIHDDVDRAALGHCLFYGGSAKRYYRQGYGDDREDGLRISINHFSPQ